MALVSYTQTAAGEPMQFTMNKTDLLAVPKVMADPFFYLESNWFRVSFVFKHTTSGKRFVPSFRTFTGTKYLRVREGMSGGDGFELKKIIISKSDRTFLVIKTSEIPSVGDYTFSLMGSGNGGGGGGNNAVFTTWDSNPSYTQLADGGLSGSGSGLYASHIFASSLEQMGDFEIKYEINFANSGSMGTNYVGVTDPGYGNQIYVTPSSDNTYFKVSYNGGNEYLQNLQPNGSNDIISFKRTGDSLEVKINGTLAYTKDVTGATSFKPYAQLATAGLVISKSYKV